jgi:hypothetical protein
MPMRTAVAISTAESLAHQETLRTARAEIAAGDDAAADRRIRGVLDATRATRPNVWFLAVANLSALYMRQAREIESLRLARLLVDECRGRHPSHPPFALQTLCMAFANLHDRERLARELPAFEAAAAAYDGIETPANRRAVALLRATVAHRHDELDEARLLCESVIASFDATATEVTRSAAFLISATVAHRAGRFVDGLAAARFARMNAPTPSAALPAIHVETQCAFELDGAAAACAVVRAAMPAIEAAALSSREPSHAVECGSLLAEFVARRCDDEDLARRLLDAATASVLRRAEELGQSLDDLPELAVRSPDDEMALVSFRVRFRLGKEKLLAAVAQAVARGRPGAAFLRADGDALVCVCAWCLRIRRRGGDWAPLGHLFEGSPESRVTHGICADCASRF